MLNPGTHTNTTDTMAAAMEAAFDDQWSAFNGDLPKPTPKQMAGIRLMFVAVAQGVVQHLRDNHEAFNVTTESAEAGGDSHSHPAEVTSISTIDTTA